VSIFETLLPDGWSRATVEEHYGITKKPRSVDLGAHERIPFVPMDGVPVNGRTQLRHELRAPDEITSGTYFERGDILLSKITPSFENGKQGKADDLPSGFGYASTEVIPIRPHRDADGLYLFYYLLHPEVREHLVATMEGSTGRQRVPENAVRKLTMPYAPAAEQRRISAVLREAQSAVEIQAATVTTTRELKQAVMRQVFACGVRQGSQVESEFGPLPAEWPTVPLGTCCTVQSGVTKGRDIAANEAIEVPYLRVANVQDGHIDLSEVKTIAIRRDELARFLIRDGDVLLTEGGDLDKLGRGFIWRGQIANCVHQNHVFAVRAHRDVLLPEFLAYLVQSPYGRAYFLAVAHKTTNLATINSTKLKAFPVPLPPLDEQREIVRVLEAIDRKIDLHERKRATLQELFDTLLHDLMTGRLRVDALAPDALAAA